MGAKKKEEGGAKDASSQDTWGGRFAWQVVNIKQGPTTSETEKKSMEKYFVQVYLLPANCGYNPSDVKNCKKYPQERPTTHGN